MTAAPLELVVAPGEAGRVDRVLAARFPGAGRRLLADLFARRQVRLDGAVARKGDFAAAGARIQLAAAPPDAAALRVVAEPGPLAVLHEEAELVVVAKPPGIPSHPLRAEERGTLANFLVARYPECREVGADPREAGLVHRLDAGTSGAIAAARNAAAWERLRAAFGAGAVRKEYLALVAGDAPAGACDLPIATTARGTAAVGRGQPARTSWSVERRLAGWTLLRCVAHTGRLHQVRVHLAAAGHPVAGDDRYGPGPPLPHLVGHFLHAARLVLPRPDGSPLTVDAPLAEDRERALAALALA